MGVRSDVAMVLVINSVIRFPIKSREKGENAVDTLNFNQFPKQTGRGSSHAR